MKYSHFLDSQKFVQLYMSMKKIVSGWKCLFTLKTNIKQNQFIKHSVI